MNKKLLIILGLIFIIIVAVIVIIIVKNNSNKKLELVYEINAGIPFKWEYEIADETIVAFDKSYVIRDDNTNGKVGASIYTKYVFKGLKEGKTTITFREVSITGEHDTVTEDIHKVVVDKDLNISLE